MTTATTDIVEELPSALVDTLGFTAEASAAIGELTGEPEWAREERAASFALHQRLGLPTTRDEHWRFTKLRGLKLDQYAPFTAAPVELAGAERSEGDAIVSSGPSAAHMTIVDGEETSLLVESLPEGVLVLPLADAMRDHEELVRRHLGSAVRAGDSIDDTFVALAEATWSTGVFVYVPRGVKVEQPIRADLLHATAGGSVTWRALVVLEELAEVTFVEEFASLDAATGGFSNAIIELVAGQGSHLKYLTIQDWAAPVAHFATHRLLAHKDAQVEWTAVGLGASMGKSRMEVRMVGAGSSVHLNGIYFLDGTQNLDYDTQQFHEAPNAMSDLAFRGVQSGKATSVWRGMIDVARDAQGTDSYQENRNLLLSPTTHADSIPGLQIEANEVRCTHGATTSKLDADQLFYLMARGLSRAEATKQIARGFYIPVLDRVSNEAIREGIQEALFVRLDAALQA
jgi:Fe-S cluster assembly protein SufD